MIKRKIDVNSDTAFEMSCQNNDIILTAKGVNSKPVSYIDLNGKEKIISSKKMPKELVFDPFYVGDTVKVHARVRKGSRVIKQVFVGTVLSIQNSSRGETFTVKTVSNGVDIKKTWLMHSPNLTKVEVVRRSHTERLKYLGLGTHVSEKVKTMFNSQVAQLNDIIFK